MNLANISTLIFITTLIFLHEVFSVAALLYLALYTSYVGCWLIKHYLFPNPRFERDLKLMDLVCSIPLLFGAYWLLPYMTVVMMKDEPIQNYHVFISIVCFCMGLATMMIADAENFYLLEHSPDDIGEIGLTRLIVAPNIIGEALLYCSFATLSQSPSALLLLGGLWIVLFQPVNNMKADTLVHYLQKWEYWKQDTGMYYPDLDRLRRALFLENMELKEESTEGTDSPSENSEEGYERDESGSAPSGKRGIKSYVPFSADDQKDGEEEDEPALFDGKGPTSGLHHRQSPMHSSKRGQKKP